jgi:hypothetical protein
LQAVTAASPPLSTAIFLVSNTTHRAFHNLINFEPITTNSNPTSTIMSGRQPLIIGGVAAVGGISYYLYSAGGDPKLAEKKLERKLPDDVPTKPYLTPVVDDAANLTRRARGDFPGQDKEAKKAGEEGYEQVRSTIQQYVRPISSQDHCARR